jgi:3'(2'), 5'-bisphosphate nucleotidase
MTNIIDLPALAEQLVAVALEAGAVIMQIYAAPAAARVKTDGSPVTEADERAEAVITQHLAALAPEIPIIAEEAVAAGRAPATAGNFFLVDPLDGTKEFISGNGEFTVNIALIQDGVPVWGVVYAPALGLIYTGGKEIPPRRGNVVAEKISGGADRDRQPVPWRGGDGSVYREISGGGICRRRVVAQILPAGGRGGGFVSADGPDDGMGHRGG